MKKGKYLRLISMCAASVLVLGGVRVYATELLPEAQISEIQTENQGEESVTEEEYVEEIMPISMDYPEEEGNAISNIFESNPADAQEPVYIIPDENSTYKNDFEYTEDVVFSGIFETNTMYFSVPKYWDAKYAYAQIELSLSRLIEEDPASMTFMVNGVPVTSYKIDYNNGKKQVFTVEIPIELLKENFNTFDITGYVRIYDEEGCIDDLSGANWVCLSKDSFIRVGYELKENTIAVRDFPYPFMSSIDSSGNGLTIAVSDQKDTDEIAAALVLRSYLRDETDTSDEITLGSASIMENDQRRILVSLYNNLPAELKAEVDSAKADKSLNNQAVIVIPYANADSASMIITSDNSKCLMEAVALLMDEDRVSQEKTNVAFAELGGIAAMQDAMKYKEMESDRYTLDALVESGLYFVGPFHQQSDIFLPFSGGFVLSDSAKISLKFRYSENLDFERSMITVYWGNVPVASKKLSRENAGGDTLSFIMPDDVIGTYAGKLSIAFDLEIDDLFCTPRMDEMPWAYVSEDSVIFLPVGTNADYRFDDRPYPFEIQSRFNDVVVAIPDDISNVELETLGQLVSVYGLSLKPYGNLSVVKGSKITNEDKSKNVIVLGTFADNKLISELNKSLTFSFDEKGSGFVSNKVVLLSEEYGRTIATLQLFASPYNAEKAMMVVCAPTDNEMASVGSFLAESENLWKLKGDTILIDTDLEMKSYDLVEKIASQDQPVIKSLMQTNEPAVIFTIISTAVIALMLIAILLILIRIYLGRNKK